MLIQVDDHYHERRLERIFLLPQFLDRSMPISAWPLCSLPDAARLLTNSIARLRQSILTSPESRPTVVVVVNYPLEYFARRIGGDLIQVRFPVPENRDPAYWEPSGDQIAEFQSADLILLNGADYAKWTLRATLPWSRTIVTCEGMEEELIEIPDAVVHSHGPEGEHSHAGLVSETWLDPDSSDTTGPRGLRRDLGGLAPDHTVGVGGSILRSAA